MVDATHTNVSADELEGSSKRQCTHTCTRNADGMQCTGLSDHFDVMDLFDIIQRKDLGTKSSPLSASDIAYEEVERYRKLLVLTESDHVNLLKPENILPW